MNDKKDYTEEVLPDGTIRQNMEGKAFFRYRTKKSLDFAEKELRRSLNVILNDIRKFKSAVKNIKTENEQEELLLQLDSSLATINKLLEDEPLLKEYVSDIKIDDKLLREFGYSPNAFEVMRERARIRLKSFQKELLNLEDEVMSIDFTKKKDITKPKANFSDIIQYPDKEKLLKRLHELIDGRSGADVGCIILSAKLNNYIIRNPTRKEFESEFEIIGSWTAITNYFSESNNALDRANKIVLFEE